jgi:hypothetical protein
MCYDSKELCVCVGGGVTMSRKKLQQVRGFLHFNDNTKMPKKNLLFRSALQNQAIHQFIEWRFQKPSPFHDPINLIRLNSGVLSTGDAVFGSTHKNKRHKRGIKLFFTTRWTTPCHGMEIFCGKQSVFPRFFTQAEALVRLDFWNTFLVHFRSSRRHNENQSYQRHLTIYHEGSRGLLVTSVQARSGAGYPTIAPPTNESSRCISSHVTFAAHSVLFIKSLALL